MIILLGASGYVGGAFRRELERRQLPFLALSRQSVDYTHFPTLIQYFRKHRPRFLINAAGYTGRPNVDACETARADTLQGNTLFPITLSHACQVEGIPWAHISSGCIYNGAKIHIAGETTVETDLTASHLRSLLDTRASAVQGFNEEDPPNFSFRHPPCSFYSGSKALAEESLVKDHSKYLWRLRIPFDEWDNSRNYLSKLQRYSKVYDNYNSLSHLRDFAKACLDLYECKVPYGTYNVTNPGYVSSRQVVEIIQRIIKPNRKFEYWAGDEEFYRAAVTTPRSNCILDVSKLLAAGIRIRSVEDALVDALEKWQPESNPARSPN